jgi:hypothetical protein
MLRDCQTGGEIDRLGAGACRGSRRCLRHRISAVGPKIPCTKAVKTARAGPFTSRQTSSHRISWMFRRSSSAVATSREGHRSPRSLCAHCHESRPPKKSCTPELRKKWLSGGVSWCLNSGDTDAYTSDHDNWAGRSARLGALVGNDCRN